MKKLRFILFIFTLAIAASVHAQSYAADMAKTVMTIWKDSFSLDNKPAKWAYDQGVILKGFEGIWMNTADPQYFNYIQKSIDYFVNEDGKIKTYKSDDYSLDNINNGKLLLLLYRVTLKEKYLKAAQQLREQLQHQPRTNEGAFWHKKIYPYQMWLDGLYMGAPFYAEYAWLSHDDTAFHDIAKQFIFMEKHARDARTGLLYHGWDESKQQKWANAATGTSPNFWGRAMGWYGMALVDVLDYFPDNADRKELIAILNRFVNAIEKVQDSKTGLWWDILNMPDKKGNYPEASASSMFVYAVAKGVRKGYLPAAKISIAKKGYDGLTKQFIKTENGQTNLYGTVKVSGLGGNPYRDGSYAYYTGEPVIVNDPKGVGAFILACDEMEMQPSLNLGKGKTVLLDNYFNHEIKKDAFGKDIVYHYVWDELDNNGYSLLGHIFNKYGVQTRTLGVAPTAQNLKDASIYVIVDPDTDKETANPNYVQPKDIEAIKTWVKNGGVLVLLGNDAGNAEFQHFNQLATAFGIRFDENSKNKVQGNNFSQGAILIPANNAILKTTKKIYIKELSTVSITSPATIALKNGDDNIIAVSKFGKGTVFAIGDPWLYNEYTDGRKIPMEYQNYNAANDLVKWLINQTKK